MMLFSLLTVEKWSENSLMPKWAIWLVIIICFVSFSLVVGKMGVGFE